MGRGQQLETGASGVTATRRAEIVARGAAAVKAAVLSPSDDAKAAILGMNLDPVDIGYDVRTHAEIEGEAAMAAEKWGGPAAGAVKGAFGPSLNDVRAACGVPQGESAEIQVVFDRSGSVHGKPALNREQILMAEQWADLELQSRKTQGPSSQISVGLSGYDGSWKNATVYEIKPAGGPHNDPDEERNRRTINYMSQLGGGGTPTTQGVVHGIRALDKSSADAKFLVVVTDGRANQVETCALAVAEATQEGVNVIGALQDPDQDTSFMDEQFGAANWFAINDAQEAPRAFLEHMFSY